VTVQLECLLRDAMPTPSQIQNKRLFCELLITTCVYYDNQFTLPVNIVKGLAKYLSEIQVKNTKSYENPQCVRYATAIGVPFVLSC